jgi:hypothetical protein
MLSSAKIRSADKRRVLGAALAALLAAAVVVATAAPAQATCGDWEVTKTYNGPDVSGWYVGSAETKQNVGCYDGNVRHSNQSASHRGQWKSDAGAWNWSSVGPVWINAGTQSPVKVLIAGPISVGRPLRIGSTWHESWGKWWF